jgi:hypothetical protein
LKHCDFGRDAQFSLTYGRMYQYPSDVLYKEKTTAVESITVGSRMVKRHHKASWL